MKKIFIVGIFCVLTLIGCLLFNDTTETGDPRGDLFAGAAACAKCHSSISNSYLHTAHYIASLPANPQTVHGSFNKDSNEFKVKEGQKVVMEKQDSGLFQTYYLYGKLKEKHRFDIVMGGIKGESYLSWKGNSLYQLPLSYYTGQQQWSTSPGYGFNFLNYPGLRNIGKRCLECHTSYIGNLPNASSDLTLAEQFDKSTLIYSIDCERCHGPAREHVEYQTLNPLVKTAKYITAYSSLNRSRKVDMCAVCHSGNPEVMLRSTFDFKPGATYARFKLPDFNRKIDTNNLDVHGNQVQLLESSKCFKKSKMDCATCHNPHENSRGNTNLFTQKCLSCHNAPDQPFCKLKHKISDAMLAAKCISCHMPAQTSNSISVQVSDKLPYIRFSVHTHRIAVYPQETKNILAYLNK